MKQYTLLKMNGETQDLGKGNLTVKDMYKILGCSVIELIPQPYYGEQDGLGVSIWGDEEARFNEENTRNPFTKVLSGNPELGEPEEWDCVGDLIKEEPISVN